MANRVDMNAVKLLRAMNEHVAKGRSDVVVGPDPRIAAFAGVELGPDLDAAMEWLIDKGALQPDYELNERASRFVGQPDYGMRHYITEKGFDMLR